MLPANTGLKVYECELSSLVLGVSASTTIATSMEMVQVQGCLLSSISINADAEDILTGNNIIRGTTLLRSPETVVIGIIFLDLKVVIFHFKIPLQQKQLFSLIICLQPIQ